MKLPVTWIIPEICQKISSAINWIKCNTKKNKKRWDHLISDSLQNCDSSCDIKLPNEKQGKFEKTTTCIWFLRKLWKRDHLSKKLEITFWFYKTVFHFHLCQPFRENLKNIKSDFIKLKKKIYYSNDPLGWTFILQSFCLLFKNLILFIKLAPKIYNICLVQCLTGTEIGSGVVL